MNFENKMMKKNIYKKNKEVIWLVSMQKFRYKSSMDTQTIHISYLCTQI